MVMEFLIVVFAIVELKLLKWEVAMLLLFG
jgi:hypothetical protein